MIAISQGISNTAGVKRSLRYVSRDGAITFTKNLISQANDIDSVEQEYLENIRFLDNSRGRNLIFSETLSMPIDNNMPREAQIKVLKELTTVHTNNRQLQDHLGYFTIHDDKSHLHCHCIYSSNSYMGNKRHRVSKAEFLNSQRSLENYRNKTYPQLKPSNHYSKKLEKRIKIAEGRMKHLRKAITKKQVILDKLNIAMTKTSSADFHSSLKQQDLVLYIRGKKTIGLHDLNDKKNYRLNTLQKGMREKYLTFQKSLDKSKKIAITKAIKATPKKPLTVKTKPIPKPKPKKNITPQATIQTAPQKRKPYGR